MKKEKKIEKIDQLIELLKNLNYLLLRYNVN